MAKRVKQYRLGMTEEEEKEVLTAMAVILKRNCEKYPECEKCPLYGRHAPYVGFCCPISIGDNPSVWPID